MTASLSPDHILQTGMAFWGSKALLSAVELGVFTVLAEGPHTGEQLRRRLGLHPRAIPDFLDTLLALGFVQRDGSGEQAAYGNTVETQFFLDRASPGYIGGILEMANARLYPFWAGLTEALRTGQPQNETKHSGEPMFAKLYEDPARLEQFMAAMSGISAGNFALLADRFDFGPYRTLADIGGATGQLACLVAARHPHLRCTTLDLPKATAIAERHIERCGLAERVQARPIDFFNDAFPQADVITMGMILHDWNLEKKLQLMRKAYAALPPGGCLIAVDNLIDDDRRHNAFGLLMSLNMLIEFGDAFDYTGADFDGWARGRGLQAGLSGRCCARHRPDKAGTVLAVGAGLHFSASRRGNPRGIRRASRSTDGASPSRNTAGTPRPSPARDWHTRGRRRPVRVQP